MARLGELIKSQRLKYNMTAAQLAKKCGVSEGFVNEVEQGKRIPNDVIAARLLKAMGSVDTLSDMAIDAPPAAQATPAPVSTPPKKQAKPPAVDKNAPVSPVWMDALSGSGLVRQVPVFAMDGAKTGARALACEGGKIEGFDADKVFYLTLEDDSLRFYRLMAGDMLLCAPHPGLIDGEVMAFTLNGKRHVRFLRKMQSDIADMIWYDAGENREPVSLKAMSDFARIIRIEFYPKYR